MTDPITATADRLAAVLDALEQADEQYHAWREERESLIRQAKALGASHRGIASRTSLSHTGVGRLIARTTPDRSWDPTR
ncbi:hypothetical protein JOD54_001947 [Actinokineospora baliensis]|uniref:hypothetical protein n=1 Tax=Actinokineospora baliensis TaxID=547056 RepID=UPI001959EB25|nr:hypothetical protein [Actinokineospora baliensis]MBM7771743.1 hypothetical protein [Actinokineospora baliensis]